MLNETRVKLMTKMARFEAEEGRKSIQIGTYFRGDYIGKEVIKSIVYGTIAFFIILAVYVAYDFEFFMQDIYKMDLLDFGKILVFNYLKLVVIYSVITYIVYTLKYQKARRNLRSYYNNLKRLHSMYRKEAQEKKERRNSED